MQEVNRIITGKNNKFDRKLLPIVVLWATVIVTGFVIWGTLGDGFVTYKNLYMMPWILMSAVVIAAPNFYLLYKKEFALFHPLVFAAWLYFFPAFVVAGLLISFGIAEPYFINYVKDPETNFPLAYIIVMLGYGGLSIGFLVPIGRICGDKVKKYLPTPRWKKEFLYIPGIFLLCLGVITTAFAYVVGVLGYQSAAEIGAYDGLIFLVTLFSIEASFFLFLLLFRRGKFDAFAVVIALIVLSVSLTKSLFAGNRGSLFSMAIMITFAYLLAGRKINVKQGFVFAAMFTLAILLGMIYGTTFRSVKQTETKIGIDEYTNLIFETFGTIGERDNTTVVQTGLSSLGDRLTETGTGLAVVVANYEDLKPYEESYGLDNNIWNDTITTFVPRVIWEDKPLASDARRYSELYFDYGLSSFSITPMGDLLRNYGLIGVPIGMFLLGFLLRFIYSSLIENQPFSEWRATLYYMIIITVSYESFYGIIIPYLVKFGVFTVIGLLIINFLAKKHPKPLVQSI